MRSCSVSIAAMALSACGRTELEIRPSESTTPDSAADAAIDERIESAVESPSTGSTRGSIPRQFPRRSWTAAKQTQVPVPHRIRTPMARSGRKWLHVRGNIERDP
jgi:hypothetical protein